MAQRSLPESTSHLGLLLPVKCTGWGPQASPEVTLGTPSWRDSCRQGGGLNGSRLRSLASGAELVTFHRGFLTGMWGLGLDSPCLAGPLLPS